MARVSSLLALALTFAFALASCADDKPAQTAMNLPDAYLPPILDSSFDGTYVDHMTIPIDPLDRVDTEPTPLVDLPLVVARPRGPLSTSTIQVLVLDTDKAPLSDIGVVAGGPMVFTNAFGIANIDVVYGEQIAEVYAYAGFRTLGHARVPIRDGQQSHTVIQVAPFLLQRIDEISVAGDSIAPPPPPPPPLPDGSVIEPIDAGPIEEPEPQPVTVEFPSEAFELPWGSPAMGPAYVLSARLSEPAEAGAVPGAMLAVVPEQGQADTRVLLDAVMSFELRVTQGRSELSLLKEVEATVRWPADRIPAADAPLPSLYYFEPDRGAFIERGSLRSAGDAVIATVDRTGHWLIGVPAAQTHCTRVGLRESGNPIAHAGVLIVGAEKFTAARVETETDGAACGLLAGTGAATVEAIGQGAAGVVRASGSALISANAVVACSLAECSIAELDAESLGNTCVRARVSSTPGYEVSVYAGPLGSGGGSVYLKDVMPGEEHCFDVAADSELLFNTAGCGNPRPTGSNGAFCGDDGCLDLGTIQCCNETEWCNPSAPFDDDCDGMIDEGCACGGIDCSLGTTEQCCTTRDTCGLRSPFTDACVGREEPFGSPGACPLVEVPLAGGDGVTAAPGCCRLDGRCGLLEAEFGCVSPDDITLLWGPSVVFTETPCTP